jgi:hypothetical protein
MAKLSDVQYSLSGEPSSQGHSEGEKLVISEIREVSTPGSTRYHIFKLVSNTRKGGVHVPGIDDVINPKTGKMERIRLLTGVDTIWLKEQKDITPEYARMNQRNLSFVRGTKILRIPEYDHTALEFARLTRHNIGSPVNKTGSHFEFYEYNPEREQQELLRKEELEIKMAILAQGMPADKMKKHAAFLGIRLIDDLGLPKSEEGLRREYMIYAKRNPEYFEKTVESKEVEVAWMVKRAILDSKLEIGREPGKVYWANGGGFIAAIPKNENIEQYLVNLALTNTEEGREFKDRLTKVIS